MAQAVEVRQPNGERYDYVSLCLAPAEVLEQITRTGTMPDMAAISGWEYRGWNTSPLAHFALLRKFKKGFYREDPTREHALGINGYNVAIKQNGLGEPWIDVLKGGEPMRHSYYAVYPVDLCEIDNRYPNALMLNYGRGRNFVLDPSRVLRDYLVQVYPDDPTLLLGKAMVALLHVRFTISYFALGRAGESPLAK